MSRELAEQEFSYFVDSSDIGSNPVKINVILPDEDKNILCQRLGLHSIDNLKADIILERNSVNKFILAKGKIIADICQKCVVTTEPVHEIIEEKFESWFAEPNQAVSFAKARRERMSRKECNDLPMMEECEDPDIIVDGKIDLGELVVQYFSLFLTSYPRTKDTIFENDGDKALGVAPEGTYDNPFAALKDWKAGESKKDK